MYGIKRSVYTAGLDGFGVKKEQWWLVRVCPNSQTPGSSPGDFVDIFGARVAASFFSDL